MSQPNRVIVFDDFSLSNRYLYRDAAAQAAEEAGLEPHTFVRPQQAANYLFDNTSAIHSVVTALGERKRGTFEYDYPAKPLLFAATTMTTPVALLTGVDRSQRHIDPAKGDIIVPKQDYEQIIPTLNAWFEKITAGAVRA
jgi:hypothetical protein